jgi:hypothetical protein
MPCSPSLEEKTDREPARDALAEKKTKYEKSSQIIVEMTMPKKTRNPKMVENKCRKNKIAKMTGEG